MKVLGLYKEIYNLSDEDVEFISKQTKLVIDYNNQSLYEFQQNILKPKLLTTFLEIPRDERTYDSWINTKNDC